MTLRGLWVALVLAISLSLMPMAQAQTFQVIHSFGGVQDGAIPVAGLTLDKAGNLYGTTYGAGGGDHGNGNVYQLKYEEGNWTFNPLYFFPRVGNGVNPLARVIFGPDGSLYGTTEYNTPVGGYGTVFQLKPPPSACKSAVCPWTETTLYSFTGPPGDGANPWYGDLIFDPEGHLWGTTGNGGSYSSGTVYSLKPTGNGWAETAIYSFANSPDGANPANGIIFGNDAGSTRLP
jgi:uncharacterized repeat protein (TIGR03803 family)